MKSIDTLVSDIYGLFSDDETPPFSEDSVRGFAEKLSQRVNERIAESRVPGRLRLSNIGKPCRRQLWYSVNEPEAAEQLPPEARIKFLFGDILEEMLLWLAKEAGHTVEGEQDEIDLYGVKGHRDGVIDGHLVDVKSASSYSFSKFRDHLTPDVDAFGYIPQLQSYLHGSSDDSTVRDKSSASFLVIDKTLGKIALDTHQKDNVDYRSKVDELQRVLSEPTPPDRAFKAEPFGKSGNEKLGVACSYCPFRKACWPGLRTFSYSTGPVSFTKIVREPDVPEV